MQDCASASPCVHLYRCRVHPTPADATAPFPWLETVVSGVIVVILGAAILWAWNHRGAIERWYAGQVAAAKTFEERASENELAEMRAQVALVAKERQITLAITATGSGNPTTVTWADGRRTQLYSDFETYKREKQAGRAHLTLSSWGSLEGTPVCRWNEAQVKAWLTEHAD